MATEVPPGRDINLRFEVLDKSTTLLRVRYAAENVSPSDLYLFNRLWHGYSARNVFTLDTNLVYIGVRGNSAWLLKGIPDIPERVFVEMPIVPCVTLLSRGQTMDETFQIELPLRQFNPYKRKERTVIENPTSIIFSLGYFPVVEIGSREVNYVSTTQGQALYAYVTPWDQLVVSTPPVPLAISQARSPEQRRCPKCGAENLPGSRFCSQCGSQL